MERRVCVYVYLYLAFFTSLFLQPKWTIKQLQPKWTIQLSPRMHFVRNRFLSLSKHLITASYTVGNCKISNNKKKSYQHKEQMLC